MGHLYANLGVNDVGLLAYLTNMMSGENVVITGFQKQGDYIRIEGPQRDLDKMAVVLSAYENGVKRLLRRVAYANNLLPKDQR